MDAIAMHQAGFTNTVAALGTAFPDEQIQLIARYADRINLIFDADGAGQKATARAIDRLRKTGLDVRVVTIPDGKDPDEFIKRNGAEAFKLLLERSANAVEHQLLEIGRRNDIQTSNGKIAYLKDAVRVLSELDSPVERDVYAGRLSELLSISKEAILQEIDRARRSRQRSETKRRLPELVRKENRELSQVNPQAAAHPRAAGAEESLLGALLLHPDYIRRAAEQISPEQFVTEFNRGLYQRLLERQRQGLLIELPFLSANYNERDMAYIARMLQQARERTDTPEDVAEYASIIREEYALRGMTDPAAVSDDELRRMMAVLREKKNKS